MAQNEDILNTCEECVPAPTEQKWWIQIVPTPRWLRVKVGDMWIADSKRAVLINEAGRLPVYYFPQEDVRFDLLQKSGHHTYNPHKGQASYWNIVTDGRIIENAVWGYLDPEPESAALKGYVAFVWKAADHWYEEEEEVFLHPRDPYTRIDAIPSSRHIQVILNGQIVADSVRPVILFETGLTPRYYLPEEDIRMEYFIPSETQTRCPYKGIASYLSAEVGGKRYDDIVWSYQEPVPELPKIKGLYSFYNENVDQLTIDGEPWVLQQGDRLPYKKVPTDYDNSSV